MNVYASGKLTLDEVLSQGTLSDLGILTGNTASALTTSNSGLNLSALTSGMSLSLPAESTNGFTLSPTITTDWTNGINWTPQSSEYNINIDNLLTSTDNIVNPFQSSFNITPSVVFDYTGSPLASSIPNVLNSLADISVVQQQENRTTNSVAYRSAASTISLVHGGGTGIVSGYYGFIYEQSAGNWAQRGFGTPIVNSSQAYNTAVSMVGSYSFPVTTSITSTIYYDVLSFADFPAIFMQGLTLPVEQLGSDGAITASYKNMAALSDSDLSEVFASGLPGGVFCLNQVDPLIFDLTGNGFKISSVASSGVVFDMDNDGYLENTAWFGTGNAALVIDLNNNGKIDGAFELVSENFNTKPGAAPQFKTGFDVLRYFDQSTQGGNNDGVMDSQDLVYSRLQLWQDNGNAKTETGELIAFSGAINLNQVTSTNADYNGSRLAMTAAWGGAANRIGQFYFSINEDGVAFARDAAGLFVVSEDRATTSYMGDASSQTIDLTALGIHRVSGGQGDDIIIGSSGDDVLAGGQGVDQLSGGAGNDQLNVDDSDNLSAINGGDGFDTLVLSGSTGRTIAMTGMAIEQVIAGLGDDVIIGAGTSSVYIKAGGGNDMVIGGIANDIMGGGDGNDVMYGSGGTDVLQGGLGNDVLNGGSGTDWMMGGAGNDAYSVDDAADTVVEVAGEGVDLVESSLNWILGAELENLQLLGSAALTATGNSAANTLTGNQGDNQLAGLAGDDILDGGAGSDSLVGGDGSRYPDWWCRGRHPDGRLGR